MLFQKGLIRTVDENMTAAVCHRELQCAASADFSDLLAGDRINNVDRAGIAVHHPDGAGSWLIDRGVRVGVSLDLGLYLPGYPIEDDRRASRFRRDSQFG